MHIFISGWPGLGNLFDETQRQIVVSLEKFALLAFMNLSLDACSILQNPLNLNCPLICLLSLLRSQILMNEFHENEIVPMQPSHDIFNARVNFAVRIFCWGHAFDKTEGK